MVPASAESRCLINALGALLGDRCGEPMRDRVEVDADSERTVHDFDDTEPRDPFV